MEKTTCQRCSRLGYCGPWKENGFTWLCGSCKLKLTMTPERTEKLKGDVERAIRFVTKKEQ